VEPDVGRGRRRHRHRGVCRLTRTGARCRWRTVSLARGVAGAPSHRACGWRAVSLARLRTVRAAGAPTLATMPFPRKFLNSYEEIAIDLHPHWMYFAEPIATVVGAIVAAVLIVVKWDPRDGVKLALVVAVLVAAAWLAIRYLKWVTTNFVITTDRVIFRHGVLSKAGVEIPLDRINNVNFNQSVFERIIGAGDLTIESAGKDGQSRFTDIRKPETVQNMLHAQMEGNETRRIQRANPPAPAPMPPPAAVGPSGALLEQLDKLEDLRQRGVLTQAEFDAQKAKLLGS
jgi:membrane protein YdbS with pleckstrin-like domain